MWRTCEYVSRPCELVFPMDLFFDFFPFGRRTPGYYVLSALNFGEFNRFDGSIYRDLRELSLFINTTWLWDDNRGNSYILIAFVD